MQNLKIRVNNEAESKEAQELFFKLGYEKGACSLGCYPAIILTTKSWATGNYCSTRALGLNNPSHENHKEINMPELRAMVNQEQDEPFLTPETTLNNQYAEIEEVRKHNHYFKDVSVLNEIDVYMVLKLFNVTDPCLQHIAKKALCAGQRGHKDFKKDLQDILDTAKRAVEINNGQANNCNPSATKAN